MPPEEQEAMPRPELHAADDKAAGAVSYPLETLMALQKMLEGGIPEHATHSTPRPASQTIANSQETHAAPLDLYQRISSAIENWIHSIQARFSRRKKRNASGGKGNSAQQTG